MARRKKDDTPAPPPPVAKEHAEAPPPTPATGHYEVDVNRGAVNMTFFTKALNDRWDEGWKLAHAFEQHNNTVTIWERRDDA